MKYLTAHLQFVSNHIIRIFSALFTFFTGKTSLPPKINPIILTKPEHNPIITPRPENDWEAWQTFNPGAILLNDQVHFLYRGIGHDGISRLGYAVSPDGFTIKDRLAYPVYTHESKNNQFCYNYYNSGGSCGGAEDPRLVRVGNENTIYMTYTACDNGLRVGLTSILVEDFLARRWKWQPPKCISPLGEIHKNWLIFPEKIDGKYAILHSLKPTVQINYLDNLNFTDNNCITSHFNGGPQKNCWDKWLRGAGAPPLKTDSGWLLFYHAMDDNWGQYKVGAMLLDLTDPTKILCRAKEPILEPKETYDNNGFKPGVVYVSGAVVKNGTLLVYYGCSDSYVGVAYANLNEFLNALQNVSKPKLWYKLLKRK